MAELTPQAREIAPGHAGHEQSEVGIGLIFAFAAGLTAAIAIVIVGLAALMGLFKREESRLDANRPALYQDESGQYPAPRLQRNDTFDMNTLREEDHAALSTYGWADQGAGIARIPIERAMALIVERGLPSPTPRTASPPKAK